MTEVVYEPNSLNFRLTIMTDEEVRIFYVHLNPNPHVWISKPSVDIRELLKDLNVEINEYDE